MFAKVCTISFSVFFLGFAHSATACLSLEPPPKLEKILATPLVVFIGTVVMVGSPPRDLGVGRRMKIKVEIPIHGDVARIFEFEVQNQSDCTFRFEVGQRWFYAGPSLGDGSRLLVDEFGKVQATGQEIVQMFPEVLTLPSPSIVVQNYLNEK
jgi:hypothetical protein